jgi:hypothetical protein
LGANGQLLEAGAATNGVSGLNGVVHDAEKMGGGGGGGGGERGGKVEAVAEAVPPLNLAGLHRYPDPYVLALFYPFFSVFYRPYSMVLQPLFFPLLLKVSALFFFPLRVTASSSFFSFVFSFFLLLRCLSLLKVHSIT